MQILIKQVGWALRSCISNKLEVISMLLVSRANFEEQGFKGQFQYSLLVTPTNFSFLRKNIQYPKKTGLYKSLAGRIAYFGLSMSLWKVGPLVRICC